ncbi:MAG: hypothetical protein M1821_003615 [Bathelium mastoideum]|nr:MAG: hypothetical protein M1821_003615 [Bathelium mastoideum]
MSHSFDTSRRRSLGPSTLSHQHGGPLDPHAPPPPPALGSRSMLPPSPSQQSNSSTALSNSLPRGAPPPPPPPPPPQSFGAARDLAALNAAHRPSSSMSISSMLGSDSAAPHHVSSSSSAVATVAPLSSARPMQPPSPRRRPSSTFGQYAHSLPLDKQYSGSGSRSEGTHSAGASSPGRTYVAKSSSPELMRLQQASVSQSSAALGFRSFQPSNHEPQDRSDTHFASNTLPPRPNSQPEGPREPAFSPAKPGQPDQNLPRGMHDVAYQSRNARIQEAQSRSTGPLDFRESPSHATTPRGRANTLQPTPQPAFTPPRERGIGPTNIRDILHTRTQQPDFSPSSIDNREQIPGEAVSNVLRPSLTSQGTNARLSSSDPRAFSEDVRQYRGTEKFGDRIDGGSLGSARSPERIANPNSQTMGLSNGSSSQTRVPSLEHRLPLSEDPSHQQRSLLGVSPEVNRSRARGSPLPQAVQGAQPHRTGPGDGPAVKHEFGRMFSGLGSGVGSNTPIAGMTANGTVTPGRQTPTRMMDESERVNTGLEIDPEGTNLVREVSRGGRRGRRIKDEDRIGSDSGESRATPGLPRQRGSKRAKTSHPAHHFHHAALGHHHHHAQHRDEEVSFTGSTPSLPHSASPFNPLKFNSSYQSQPMFSTPSQSHHHHGHHHHHHHAPPHHHHHPPKAYNQAPHHPRKPQTRILSQPIINSVAHLPRKHLGSALYNPRVSIPASTTPSTIDLKHGYTSRARPIPRFNGKANCTFTIRIPRYFLRPDQREAVSGSRCLWGTDVYTDDSDPLAACIHAGWIRGAWGDDVDTDLLFDRRGNHSGRGEAADEEEGDEQGQDGTEAEPTDDILTAPPKAGPALSPEGRDLHVTVLVLPPLEVYASTTSWGIKSRGWGSNHDGMSFKVIRLEWVDEGTGRAEERSGEGRRKRLRGRMKLMKEMRMGVGREAKVVEGMA